MDYSLERAFRRLDEELKFDEIDPELWPIGPYKFVNLDDTAIEPDMIESFEGNNHVIFGYTSKKLGENANQIQTQVKNITVKGDKKWETKYIAVFDDPKGTEHVPGSNTSIKKDCIDAARAATSQTGRNTYIIIGKSPNGFDRLQSEVIYKPSQGQTMGQFTFVW